MNKKIVLVYKSVGPYHVARLSHSSRELKKHNIDLECLILAGSQSAYAWNSKIISDAGVNATVLFPDEKLESISLRRMSSSVYLYVAQRKPDLIFTANYEIMPMFLAACFTRLFGGAAVSMSDTTAADRKRTYFKEQLKKLALLPHKYAFVAGYRSKDYVESLSIAAENIVDGCDVVNNAEIDACVESYRKSSTIASTEILCVARLIEQKNMINLLEGYRRFCETTAPENILRLNICGDGPLEDDLKRYVREKNIKGVVFSGFVSPPTLFEHFANAWVLVLPSISESWGLVVNEAMAAGIPVLVSERCGCTPELVIAGKTGWSFDPLDPNDIARSLRLATSIDQAERLEMEKYVKSHISNWGLDRFTNALLKLVKLSSEQNDSQ